MTDKKTATNSTLAIGGVSCPADSFLVQQISVLLRHICGENRHLRQAPKRNTSP